MPTSRWILLSSVVVVVTVFGGIAIAPNTAHADPHAVFYTAIGQRQLFFNVLAALDQADYVEPKAGPFGRDQLLAERATEGFGVERDDAVNATSTDLSGLLVRQITLEGEDWWTAYLSHQFALERARRRGLNDVVSVFCERGLGIEGCDAGNALRDPVKAQRLKKEALVANPEEFHEQGPFYRGVLAAALSETGDQVYPDHSNPGALLNDTEFRNREIQRKNNGEGDTPVYPLSYSKGIGGLRLNNQNPAAQGVIDGLTQAAARTFIPDEVNPGTFEDLIINPDGSARFRLAAPGDNATPGAGERLSGPDYINRYIKQLNQLAQLPSRTVQSLAAAEERYDTDKNSIEKDGTKTDFRLQQRGGVDPANGNPGSLRAEILTPPVVKQEIARAPVRLIGDAETDPKYKSAEQNYTEGDTYYQGSSGSPSGVAGIQSGQDGGGDSALRSGSSGTGTVLGSVNPVPGSDLPRLGPEADQLVPFYKERFAVQALQASTADGFFESSGGYSLSGGGLFGGGLGPALGNLP